MAGERSGVGNMIALAQTAMVLIRVLLVVAFSVGIFATAYLDYFILPFTFVLIALSIVGMSNLLKQWSRFRNRGRDES